MSIDTSKSVTGVTKVGSSLHWLSSELLISQGVQEIWVACTHGVFVRGGLEKLAAIPQITEIVTTDTVYIPPEKRHPKLTVLSVATVFGDAISRNYQRESISDLFVYGEGN